MDSTLAGLVNAHKELTTSKEDRICLLKTIINRRKQNIIYDTSNIFNFN